MSGMRLMTCWGANIRNASDDLLGHKYQECVWWLDGAQISGMRLMTWWGTNIRNASDDLMGHKYQECVWWLDGTQISGMRLMTRWGTNIGNASDDLMGHRYQEYVWNVDHPSNFLNPYFGLWVVIDLATVPVRSGVKIFVVRICSAKRRSKYCRPTMILLWSVWRSRGRSTD